MDEFRIGPTSPDNPYRDNARPGARNRKKLAQAIDQEDVVSLSAHDAGESGGAQDYYSPARDPEDGE